MSRQSHKHEETGQVKANWEHHVDNNDNTPPPNDWEGKRPMEPLAQRPRAVFTEENVDREADIWLQTWQWHNEDVYAL